MTTSPSRSLGTRTRVLCTYANTFNGGVQRVITDGLPYLSSAPDLDLEFSDLYSRDSVMGELRRRGTRINPSVGISGPPLLSSRTGTLRLLDLAKSLPRHLRLIRRLRAASRGYDVLYTHAYKDLALAFAALTTAMEQAPKLVWHCHGLGDGRPPRYFAQVVSRSSAVIAISETVRRRLVELGVEPERVHVVHNAVDHERVRGQASAGLNAPVPDTKGRTVVLSPVASLRSQKGVHLLVSAMADLPSDFTLWLTGATQDPTAAEYVHQIRTTAARLGVANRIHFLGFRSDIYAVMRQCDIVCLASTYREGFGLIVAEAMSLGKPVAVSDRGALPEVVDFGDAGLIFDPASPASIAAALSRLQADRQYAADLGARGRAYSESHFAYPRWAEAVSTHLRNAAQEN